MLAFLPILDAYRMTHEDRLRISAKIFLFLQLVLLAGFMLLASGVATSLMDLVGSCPSAQHQSTRVCFQSFFGVFSLFLARATRI